MVVTDLTGLPQAWAAPARGGWPHQVTFADDRVQWVAASPVDPDVVVFGRDSGGDERTQLHRVRPDGTDETPLTEDPASVHRFGAFTPDGSGLVYTANERNGVDFDCHLRPLQGGPSRLVTTMTGSHRVSRVTPDGGQALVVRAYSPMLTDLLLVDLATGSERALTTAPARHFPADFSPDGRWLFLVSDAGGEFARPVRADLTTGTWVPFGPDDHDVDDLAVRAGTGVVSVNDDGRSRVWTFDPGTLALTGEVDLPLGVASELELAPGGDRVVFTFSGPALPRGVREADVRRGGRHADVRPKGREAEVDPPGPSRALTGSPTAGIPPESFVEPTTVRIAADDGLLLPALVSLPEHVAAPRAVISVHGGPESQERPRFHPLYQYLLARGFAVVAPNVRGSTGYGRRYASLDDRERRHDAIADLAAVARWVAAHPRVNGPPAVMGASYGGYLTLAGLTTYPDLFAAGVSIVGMADLVTFLEHTSGYRRAQREAEYGGLAEDRQMLAELSPLRRVEAVRAPLLVIHGANDPRVPVGETTELVDRLRRAGGTVESVIFDDEGHGIVRFANRVTAYQAVADFLERHLLSAR